MGILASTVFELVDCIVVASSALEAWRSYLAASSKCGLPYGLLHATPFGDPSEVVIVDSAMPKSYIEGYNDNALADGDLVLARARASTASFEWQISGWAVDKMAAAQRRWREHCRTFGITGGLCVLDFRPGQEMMLSLQGQPGVIDNHDRLALCFAGHELINRIKEFADVETSSILLSQRERQCLEWAAVGKTDWEIGRILSLSEKTVNVYINRAKSKFGVKSRAQAILKASKAGLIAA